ncbi:hypothetical protein [Desulfotomaculum copahuensis]|uniref:Uncharacterized protein n=1 Tax=Desulfotomaculum copahuensis TaxID=1838280 RepID=A0A1B7LFP7_9FIRM|nr:hypothetical protein [Desulfotomaculum copahuensis]OAT83485.1 hypothetical protein A6M21_08095 [Desulfotomaculum copahuensis]
MRRVVSLEPSQDKEKRVMPHMSTREKRLTVAFPAGHPVWSYPSGQRAARVREWIDLALRLEEHMARIEEKLDALTAAGVTVPSPAPKDPEKQKAKPRIDPAIFLGL